MFTAGRYEYRNKGVDMFIESLARLNFRLQQIKSNVSLLSIVYRHTLYVSNTGYRRRVYHHACGYPFVHY
jgi:hypothetical protein